MVFHSKLREAEKEGEKQDEKSGSAAASFSSRRTWCIESQELTCNTDSRRSRRAWCSGSFRPRRCTWWRRPRKKGERSAQRESRRPLSALGVHDERRDSYLKQEREGEKEKRKQCQCGPWKKTSPRERIERATRERRGSRTEQERKTTTTHSLLQ